MQGYIDFYDNAEKWLRVVMSVFFVPAFLYRLFTIILEKASRPSHLVYLILSVLPFLDTACVVIDIVFCAIGRLLPRDFGELFSSEDAVKESKDVIDEKPEE